MASKVFAAIDVGSNELSMKVYEITPKKGAREIDYVNSTVELGSDTYNSGRITEDSIMKVCEILNKFRRKMREYDVREYKAYASSAVREAENSVMVLERIKQHTGIDVSVLSNSEQRFMNYKAYAAKSKFDDSTGLLLGRADGEWGCYLPSLSAGNINVPKGDVTARGISLSGHTHGGVETGSGSTKKPN